METKSMIPFLVASSENNKSQNMKILTAGRMDKNILITLLMNLKI